MSNETSIFANDSFSTIAWSNGSDAIIRNPVNTATSPQMRHIGLGTQTVITVIYSFGVIGNLIALTILCRGDKKTRNSKHSLLLRCLATNDLVALLGMLLIMYVQLYLPAHLLNCHWICMVRVVWRIFGLGSGCVAIVMAVERWLALTHPFLYQKHVTYYVVRRAVCVLYAFTLVLVSLPLFGFGVYYKPDTEQCVRYRAAETPKDIAYAYLFFVFGVLLAVCIVWCNLAVIRVLCHLGCNGEEKLVGRRISRISRISRTSSRGSNRSRTGAASSVGEIAYNACTHEELTFARLMAVLCIFFVICWMPQMITIPVAQFAPDSPTSRPFFRLADLLMSFHFTLDPYIYVILRCQRRPCMPAFMKLLCRSCRSSDKEPMETSMAMTDQERALHTHSIESKRTGSVAPEQV